MEILLLAVLFAIAVYIVQKKRYEKTEYYQQTQNPYSSVLFNKGRLGEFYTYKYLKSVAGYKRYLFNLYVPKKQRRNHRIRCCPSARIGYICI